MDSEDIDPNLAAATIFNMVDMVAATGFGFASVGQVKSRVKKSKFLSCSTYLEQLKRARRSLDSRAKS